MPTIKLSQPWSTSPGDRRQWRGLHGSSAALAIASAASAHSGLSVVVTRSAASAATLRNELGFFSGAGDAGKSLPVLQFPDWETLPYDLFSPHQDIISERLASLHRLPTLRQAVLVVPISTALHRLAPPEYIAGNSFSYRVGENLDTAALRRQCEQAGYRHVDTVFEHGEYAVRGALIDIYPMGSELPFRIDMFDEQIDSLRQFDPETQRTTENVEAIELLPGREFPHDAAGVKRFLDNWHTRFDVDPRQCPVYQDVKAGLLPSGVEYYLPLFFDRCASLFDYLPADALVFVEEGAHESAEHFWHDVGERYRAGAVDKHRPLLAPDSLFLPVAEFFAGVNDYPRTDFRQAQEYTPDPDHIGDANDPDTQQAPLQNLPLPDIGVESQSAKPLSKLTVLLDQRAGRVLFCAESSGRREVLLELLAKAGITPQPVADWSAFLAQTQLPMAICVYPLERGLQTQEPALTVITETELFGQQVLQRRRRQRAGDNTDLIVRNLTELMPGAPVVHIDHGVGRYQGLSLIDIDGEPQEFVTLAYAEDARVYVPVANLHLISRYSGADGELAPLHKLGSDQWQKARDKAARQIRDTAAELLEVYARREARAGFHYHIEADDYATFCAEFPFEETPDQVDAIAAVAADMSGERPMDRLICGDVGFGKTEVAFRAAFIAVSNSRQVVVLVPTTLLAQQHYDNFRDRFANWPVSIEVISRFRTGKEQQAVINKVNEGKVDILIGTHKLLNGALKYKDLGLLVIDEEHRFGVNQKEKIKALRSEIDILTLTATPIPRTLNMALGSLRDLSIIATPPAKRLSVKTFIHRADPRVVYEAVSREILRGGQVYFLHNDIKTIERAAKQLQELVPEARIAIGHGQMRERELEKVMSDFYHQRCNILVCTTIIETGIDIPTANTIVVNRADKFGLAQLHQLRGRVGRSHHQAYAYLLTPHPKQMTADAHKRLEAIAAADHLGSGFTLATHDLEIRGAGELLGDGQSGHIHNIGFTLYMELLERAVTAIRQGELPSSEIDLRPGAEVNLNIPALIPEDYVPDIHNRLLLYKRLGNTRTEQQLRELKVEMIDRFGLLPPYVDNLFRVTELRQRIEQMGITRLEAGAGGGKITFASDTLVEPLTIVELVQQHPDCYRLEDATVLKFNVDLFSAEQRLQGVSELLDHLLPAQRQVA